MSFDEKSRDLAAHFLTDEPRATEADTNALAQFIQNAVEEWLEYSLPERIEERGAR